MQLIGCVGSVVYSRRQSVKKKIQCGEEEKSERKTAGASARRPRVAVVTPFIIGRVGVAARGQHLPG